MTVSSSMFTAAAGLTSHSDAMGVISDNIANVNTVGFKASRANFADVLGGVVARDQVGVGSRIGSVQSLFTQGALLGTGAATDVAIQGDGFFVVQDGEGANRYSRAGQFSIDSDGMLVNQQGFVVQGYQADATGTVGSTLGGLSVPSNSLPPNATTSMAIDANLDASTEVSATAFDINDPVNTSDFNTSVTVYDSLGNAHQVEAYFYKTADTPDPQWGYTLAVAGEDVDPAPTTDRFVLDTGTLTFNSTDGSLASNSLASTQVQWAGADLATIAVDFGTPTGTGGTGVDGITTYAGASAVSAINQDGFSSGELSGIQIDNSGVIEGEYTNGETMALGQIGLARFAANDSLLRDGGAVFRATLESGEPLIGPAGAGPAGMVVSGTLEQSNVDLANEFVTMISVQRGFQSNSRTISTADDMLTELVNLKR